jgi:hypothetical protein
MPTKTSVFRCLAAHNAFRDQYARARDARADTLFDEILDIANKPIVGKKTKYDKDGNVVEVTEGDMIEHRRLQIDARKWMAGKLRARNRSVLAKQWRESPISPASPSYWRAGDCKNHHRNCQDKQVLQRAQYLIHQT